MPASHGEYLVGHTFNPGSNPDVDKIKIASAALIDFIDEVQAKRLKALAAQEDGIGFDPAKAARQNAQINRLGSLARTEIESAAMWAVKMATKPLPK